MAGLVALILLFLILSGVMAAVDAALLSVTRPEIHELLQQQKRGAASLLHVKQELTRAIVVVVILTNTINVLGPVLVSQHTLLTYGSGAIGIVTGIMAVGTILFSEIIPKALGTRYAVGIGCASAFTVRVLQYVLFPLVVLLERLSDLFAHGSRTIGTEQQIRALASIGHQAGHIEHDEGRLIQRAFGLNDKTANDIMTPVRDVVAVNAAWTIGTAAEHIRRSAFSRFPMIDQTTDKVTGMILARDVLEAVIDGCADEAVTSIARPVFEISSSTRSDAMLLQFRYQHFHLAVVKDGLKTMGVVSLEDVLEELVGEIEDERDSQFRS